MANIFASILNLLFYFSLLSSSYSGFFLCCISVLSCFVFFCCRYFFPISFINQFSGQVCLLTSENPGWYCKIYWHSLCIDILCAKTNHMQQWSNSRRTLKFRCQDRFGPLLRSNIRLQPQIKENQYCDLNDFAPEEEGIVDVFFLLFSSLEWNWRIFFHFL